MTRLLIIADDLTGACDSAAVFTERGWSVEVRVRLDRQTEHLDANVDVVAVDTESRHIAADEAAVRVASAVREGRAAGIDRFYKKVDSTLRGNLGAELGAAASAAGAAVLPFIPACPQAGRTTRGGMVLVDNVPVDQTAFARDPREPVTTASAAETIRRQWTVPVDVIPRPSADDLELPHSSVCPSVWVFDAETDEDLASIAAGLEQRSLLHCCAGAAGFAEHVADALGGRGHGKMKRSDPVWGGSDESGEQRPKQLLVINGSLNERSLAQVRAGLADGMHGVSVPVANLSRSPAKCIERSATEVKKLLGAGKDVLLSAEGTGPGAGAVAALLGAVASQSVASELASCGLCVFGGDTAVAVLDALGVGRFQLIRELWPGVVEARIQWHGAPHVLITKSGGFGPVDLLPSLRRLHVPETRDR